MSGPLAWIILAPMRRVALLLLIAAAGQAPAQIYRSIDEEGRVLYSDRPQPGAAAVVPGSRFQPSLGSPAVSTPAADADTPQEAAGPAADSQPGESFLGPYTSFQIVSPEPNQTFRQAEGNISLSLLLDPPLLEGHRLDLLLNGISLAGDGAMATQLSLSNVSFGSHTAQAQIRDAEGAVVARTAPVTFHLRKPIPPGVLQ